HAVSPSNLRMGGLPWPPKSRDRNGGVDRSLGRIGHVLLLRRGKRVYHRRTMTWPGDYTHRNQVLITIVTDTDDLVRLRLHSHEISVVDMGAFPLTVPGAKFGGLGFLE